MDDMWRIFMATIFDGTFGTTICVFDALDECYDQDQNLLIERLRDFYYRCPTSQGNWLKFLVASRLLWRSYVSRLGLGPLSRRSGFFTEPKP
jgi:hypothetical protein